MKVELEKSFPMPGSAEVAWEFLQNIEAVAGCMPGAKITEQLPDGRFKGTVTVRVGPATMSFRGEVEVRDIDPATRSLRLLGKGTDNTGTSGAAMDLDARVEPGDASSSNLVGKSEVSISGKAAAFGGRMMNSVADQILKQFAANFATQVAALAAQRSTAAPTGSDAERGATGAPPEAAADTGSASTSAPSPGVSSPPEVSPPAPTGNELNGLALAWAVFKEWLRSLFAKNA